MRRLPGLGNYFRVARHSTKANAFVSQRIDVFLQTTTTGAHPLISDGEERNRPSDSTFQNRDSRAFARLSAGRRWFFLPIVVYLYKLDIIESLDAAFAALVDPTRRAILARLARGEAAVNELREPFEMTQPAISQYLKVLEGDGLIVQRVQSTRRPCRFLSAGIEAMDQWLAMLRKALEANYARLEEVLAGMEKHKRGKKR